MKRILFVVVAGLVALTFLFTGVARANGNGSVNDSKIVIANRGSGTISVIDVATDTVAGTYNLPGANTPEPMYVVYTNVGKRVFVGDRTNSQVVVFDSDDFSVEATIPAGVGVFHMWADTHGRQLWVNNDIDNTATVIDVLTLEVIATVPMPADLIAQGGKPHDVILDRSGRYAFVSLLGIAGPNDYVVQFSTRTFAELNRAAVGQDPHLSLTQRNQYLYVPAQNSNVVTVLDRETLEFVTDIVVPGAHGAGMRRDGRFFYTTNLPGGGPDGLVAIDTATNQVIGATNTTFPIPHNIAITPQGEKLYVTHSGGTADKVTVYAASNDAPVPMPLGDITVGLNPFGLAFVP